MLRQKLSIVQSVERHKIQTEAVVNETCEKCGRTEVKYSAVQLRSADEGSTIFYTCDCGHKYVVPLHGNKLDTANRLPGIDGTPTIEILLVEPT